MHPSRYGVAARPAVSIGELAAMVKQVVGFDGEIALDPTKPDGTPRKLLDTTRLTGLGWKPSIDLEDGIASTYQWFLDHQEDFRA